MSFMRVLVKTLRMRNRNCDFIKLASLAVAFVFAGCSTTSPSHYTSPRITGRVIDAKSGAPIEGVQVRKIGNQEPARSLESAKGGEQMVKNFSVSTGGDGSF